MGSKLYQLIEEIVKLLMKREMKDIIEATLNDYLNILKQEVK